MVSLFRATPRLADRCSRYINFAHGDEDLESVYGVNVERLKEIKQRYDPNGHFNQWFPLT